MRRPNGNDTERQLAALAQSIAQNEQQRAIVLRAPRAGVVSTVLLKPGQMVSAGQPLLSILPAGSLMHRRSCWCPAARSASSSRAVAW
ncbi:HlyD family efflux transporter periplasmic adaptor subunit [Rhodanobacter lindaniclasticus]